MFFVLFFLNVFYCVLLFSYFCFFCILLFFVVPIISYSVFKMFCFKPLNGTYVKGFGKAYTINVGDTQDHVWHVGLMTGEKM